MTRYQIKIVDADLTDLVDEIATRVLAQSIAPPPADPRSMAAFPDVFETCKGLLKEHVRGFHVCGCLAHCDVESGRTELAKPFEPPQNISRLDWRSPWIRRYVLSLEIPLKEFTRELEVRILRAIAEHLGEAPWRGHLFTIIREAVEGTLGKYLYYSPSCNREEFMCEVGVCTEFDPWQHVQPQCKAQ